MKNITIINDNIFEDLIFLFNNFPDDEMPPTDYLNLNEDKIPEEHYEAITEMFLSLVQHRQVFNDFINFFYCSGKRKDQSDKSFLMVLTFILINILNVANEDEIIQICKREKCQKVVYFLRFLNKKSVIERLFLIGCNYFEEKYVRENVIFNLKENKELLQNIQTYFEEILATQKAEYTREPTKPVSPRITKVMRQSFPPPVPTNTPEEVILPPAKPAPASTYKKPKIDEVLIKLKSEHKTSSLQLLEEANEAAKRLSSFAKSNSQHSCSTQSHKISSQLVLEEANEPAQRLSSAGKSDTQHSSSTHSQTPVLQQRRSFSSSKTTKSEIPVKKNAATILREAARLIKEEEKDIKRVTELMSGAADHASYEEQLDRLRAEEELLKLQDVERKHLLGQLTREEAILARQRIQDANRAKRAQIEKEKKETEELLKQMRQKQEEEIRQIIDKTQQIQKNIEVKKQDMIHKKQMEAQEVANTSKQLYAETMMRQKQEMEKKMELIREIKALSSLKDLQANKFDPTETMNVGLLCEMSLVELHERLMLKRTSIKEEIENRQKFIRKQKLKQQQFLAETQQFINDCREQKKLLIVKKDSIYKQLQKDLKTETQEIRELRRRLEKARQKRIELTKS